MENRQKFRHALKEYSNIDYFMLETIQIVPGWTHFNLNNGIRLDLMVSVKGLENLSFQECYTLSSIADLGPVKIPILHINHLIDSKKAANPPKDQIDVIYLEKIRQLMKEEGEQNA